MIEIRHGHARFYEILDEMAKLHSAKAHDYAGDEDPLSNFRQVAAAMGLKDWEVGIMFIAVKFYRLINLLARGEDAENEPIEDTLMDLSVYGILTKIMREEASFKDIGMTAAEVGEKMRRAISGSG